MKKQTALLAALCLTLGACAPQPQAPQAAPQAAESAPAAASTPPAPQTPRLDVSRTDPGEAMKLAAKACAVLTSEMNVPPDSPYYPLTPEQTAQFLDAIAALGAPVTAEGFDLRNYEQVEAFAQAAARGENAMTGVFFVSDNGLSLCTLAQNEGTKMQQTTTCPFPCDTVKVWDLAALDSIELRDGFLIYAGPEGETDRYNGFRIKPLGEEKREACRKYVSPIFLSAGKLIWADWDASDLSALQPEFAFESLYALDTGTALYDAGYPQNPGNFTYTVPGDVVRRVLTTYLPVTEEWLAGLPKYDAAQDVYHWGCFAGGGYQSTPEVADIRDNGDGTTTLTVNAVSVAAFGEPCSTQSELTLEIAADGSFRYLSNRVTKPLPEATEKAMNPPMNPPGAYGT